MDIKVSFNIDKLPLFFVSHKSGRKGFEVEAFEGVLTVSVQYTFNRRPLKLNCNIKEGDRVEVILLPYRIELFVNGELKDEEWPAGDRLFELGDSFVPTTDVKVCEYTEEQIEIPSVISEFTNAEGWCPGNGVFVGDCMPYRRDDEYHVLYLKDRHHHAGKWGLGAHQWNHISTKDFKTWSVHPMAVPITDPSEGSICTGSWIRHNGKEYLFYTVRRGGGKPAPICRSVSDDGYHFVKDKDFGFTISDKYTRATTRDPKVIKGEDGLFHMFLTTGIAESNRGCLAHYISPDLDNWEEADKPIYTAPLGFDQPECPDYFKFMGRYYLVFSHNGEAHYMISDKPFEGFVKPKDYIIPCSSVPKCAEWYGRLIFAGFKRIKGYAGYMTFKAAKASDNGELVFEEL